MTKNISLALLAIFAIIFIWAGYSITDAWHHVTSQTDQNTLLGYTIGWLASPFVVLAGFKLFND